MEIFWQTNIIAPLTISFLTTVFATPIVIYIAKKKNIMDNPRTHKHPAIIHKKPIPRGGSVAIFIGILVASLLFLPKTGNVFWLLLGGALAVFVGVVDDKFDLSPYFRFLTNIASASIPVFIGGVGIYFITSPAGGGVINFNAIPVLPQILGIIWIVWTMNMLNWSKGVDGQMPGIAGVAALVIGFLSLRFVPLTAENIITVKLSFITAGAAFGFLLFNFYPAKIFPGYGATILGYLLAITSIMGGTKVATAILVMIVPTIDGVFTILRRLAAGRSPFRADMGHFHHLLLKEGWGQRRIALFYWFFSAIVGTIALTLSSREKFFALLVLFVVVGGAILWLSFLRRREN